MRKVLLGALAFMAIFSSGCILSQQKAEAGVYVPTCHEVWFQTGPYYGQGYWVTYCD